MNLTRNDSYREHSRFYVSVDCIIFTVCNDRLQVLLTKRAFAPEKGKWSLMGGFVEENESVDDAARRVLYELTGISNAYMKQVKTFGEISRDPGGRVISVAYYALLDNNLIDQQSIREHGAVWVDANNLPELGFDHPLMINKARAQLCRRITSEPIAFKLLPEAFTLSQLQNLYEQIFNDIFDKRNFRKKVAENKCIEETGEIDKKGSRRGARLYRFAEDVYEATGKFNL